jgi:hypothetical protein
MAAHTKESIARAVDMYRDDPSATVETVAEAAGMSPEFVRKSIEQAGVPIRDYRGLTDEDLGIGMDMDAITSSPAFQDAVAKAVAAAMANIVPQNAAPTSSTPEWQRFMDQMERMTDSLNVQKPGYQKPLSPEELGLRAEGEMEFWRLIRRVRLDIADHGKEAAVRMGLVPMYIIGENGFYGSTAQGETLFAPGLQIYLTVAPPEDFLPMNETAGAIMRAQMQWIGEPTPDIGELVAQAMIRAKGGDSTFIVGDASPSHSDDAMIVDASLAPVNMAPARTMGTNVPELKPVNMPFAPGSSPVPTGPVFVN